MKLDKITLKNYRNFESYEMRFGASTTVLIGKNGTGKTNLISALKQSLSFIFAKKKDSEQYDFVASSEQKVQSFSITDARYAKTPDTSNGRDYHYPIDIKVSTLDDPIGLEWSFYKENASGGLLASRYEKANKKFWSTYSNTEDIPVLAYFSDSYPHVKTNIGKNVQKLLESGNDMPRNTAFYKWDEDKSCTEIWEQYFIMQQMKCMMIEDETTSERNNYIIAIKRALIDFSILEDSPNNEALEIENIETLHLGLKQVMRVRFKNGDIFPFSQLPQGYRRMLSIVFDIANRSYMLNKNCNPQGVVIIDELELHLHPSLAQEVLQRLKKTFPRVQFIVSTHSPLVVTNFKQDNDNLLYKLYREDDGSFSNSLMSDLYGIDYNSGLGFMDTPESNSYIQDLVSAYKYWREMDNSEMVDKLKHKLRSTLGEENELYKSLINS